MRRIGRFGAATGLVVAGAMMMAPATAAATWPVGDGNVVLGFGAAYEPPDGGQSTHRGADLAAGSGSKVVSPARGAVTFAGRVPGPHGGSVLAVTVEAANGLRFTMLPLATTTVAAGDDVEDGAAVGSLAASGDSSSASPHLHVGARRGDLYVDPVPLMEPASGARSESEAPETVEDAEQTAATVSESSANPAHQAQPAAASVAITPHAERESAGKQGAAQAGAEAPSMQSESSTADGLQGAGFDAGVSSARSPQAGEGSRHAVPRPVPRFEGVSGAAAAPASIARTSALERRSPRPARAAGLVGFRIQDAARAWTAIVCTFFGATALWPLWRRSALLVGSASESCLSPVESEVVAAPGR